jgi:hypothetical protein
MMASFKRLIAFTAAGLLAAQPCAAADLAMLEGSRQSGLYGGIYVRLPIGQIGRDRQEARTGVSFGPTHIYRTANAGDGERRTQINVVDLGVVRSGRPSLTVGGRELIDERGRLSLGEDGGVSPAAIVVGLIVVAGVGYLLIREQFDCDPDGPCY